MYRGLFGGFQNAAPFNTSPYFAYAVMPARKAHMVDTYVFLSKAKCEKNITSGDVWKKSVTLFLNGNRMNNCWTSFESKRGADTVAICVTRGDCLYLLKTDFMSTASLPRTADF